LTNSQHEKPSSQSGISSFLEGYMVSHIHIFYGDMHNRLLARPRAHLIACMMSDD
jgi:hypothetical protein